MESGGWRPVLVAGSPAPAKLSCERGGFEREGEYVPAEVSEFLVNALESHGVRCVVLWTSRVSRSGACCKLGGRWVEDCSVKGSGLWHGNIILG